ncbi:MAG: bacteriohemerythrin [Bacteroidota bacterium]
MALLNWQSDFTVNVCEIDKQHQKLVEMINNLHDGMKAGKGKEVLGDILANLVKYTEFHFKYEEKLFEQYVYPETLAHKRQHSDLVSQVQNYKKSFESGESVLSMEIMSFLKVWLMDHIVGSDKKYSTFFNSRGVN